MNESGHRDALEELKEQRAKLDRVNGIRAYTELSFGMAYDLDDIGGQRQFGVHEEKHEGLARWLRDRGLPEIAETFAEVETMRIGRCTGGKAMATRRTAKT